MTAAVTINFRRPELTIQCVESLLGDGWFPVLVWDNSADDGESMRAIEAGVGGRPEVLLAGSPANLGFAAGMNKAISHLREHGQDGPVLLVNNDARVRVGLRRALEARRDAEPLAALLAPRIDQSGQDQGWMYYQPWLGLVSDHPVPGSFRYLSGCCLLVVGTDDERPLFDESFFMYGEDVELCSRIVAAGGQLALLDDVYVDHVGSASSGQATSFYERHLVRAHWLLADRLPADPLSRLAMRILRIPALLSRACIRSVRFRSVGPVMALMESFSRSAKSPGARRLDQ